MTTAYETLHDMLSDMIESGRLTRDMIPLDYDKLVEHLAGPCQITGTPGPYRLEATPSSDLVTRRLFAVRENGPDIAIADIGVPDRSRLDVQQEVANAEMILTAINEYWSRRC